MSEPYDKSFDEVKIGDTFTTATGEWFVYDKGTKTLQAFKLPMKDIPVDEQLMTFFPYDLGG